MRFANFLETEDNTTLFSKEEKELEKRFEWKIRNQAYFLLYQLVPIDTGIEVT